MPQSLAMVERGKIVCFLAVVARVAALVYWFSIIFSLLFQPFEHECVCSRHLVR